MEHLDQEIIETARGSRWPVRLSRRLALLREMERYLTFRGERTPFHSMRPGWRVSGDGPMDARMRNILRVMALFTPTGASLPEVISDEEAEEMWGALCRAFDELEVRRELSLDSAVEKWDGFELVTAIAVVVAEGMEYVMLPLQRLFSRSDALWEDADLQDRSRWRQSLEGFELFMVSFWMIFTRDFRSTSWLARQPLERGFSGLCRHYSSIVQTLFYASTRVTGRWKKWEVLTVGGRPHHLSPFGHAWNWLCDYESNVIYSFDLTGADWLLDRGEAESIFNEGFDGYRWSNMSAFLRGFIFVYTISAHRQELTEFLEDAFHAVLDLSTVRGEALLYLQSLQPGLSNEAQEWITACLEGLNFSEHIPGWKMGRKFEGAMNPAAYVVSSERQLALLETLR